MRLTSVAAVMIVTLSAACYGESATFVGQAWMEFSGASGSIPRFPVEVRMTTDYSKLTWELDWDVPETTVVGGPEENFETRFGTTGSMRLEEPLKLGLPSASGVVSGFEGQIVFDAEFFGTSRVVSRNETWFDSVSGVRRSVVQSNHSLGVAEYPSFLTLAATFSSLSPVTMSTTTTDGNTASLSGTLWRDETGFSRGISDNFTEVLPGDFNSDGLVNAADYTIGRDVEFPLTGLLADLDTWAAGYGKSSGGAPVPEPSTLVLLAAAAWTWRRNRRG